MKRSDLVVISLVALMTAVIAVALADAIPSANAVEQKKKALVPGTLTLDGVELTLKVDAETSKSGKKPVLTVTAVNASDKPVEIDAQIDMKSMPPPRMTYGRRMPMPEGVWSEGRRISLKPGETRTYELTSKAAVGRGNLISFNMTAGGKTVVLPGPRPLAKRVNVANGKPVAERETTKQ